MLNMARVLVTGASGLVGGCIAPALARDGHTVSGTYRTHPERVAHGIRAQPLDLGHLPDVGAVFDEMRPDIVVHAAAMPDLAACEADPQRAYEVNVEATGVLAERCSAAGARFIFISTDQVFDGTRGAYAEDDETNPVHVYGRSKRDAEHRVRVSGASAMVLRLALVYGRSPSGERSASEQIENALRRAERVRLFTDEIRTPVLVDDVASVVCELLFAEDATLLHVAGPDAMSRYEFGMAVATASGLDASLIDRVRQRDVKLSVERPRDLSLKTDALRGLVHRIPQRVVDGLASLATGPASA